MWRALITQRNILREDRLLDCFLDWAFCYGRRRWELFFLVFEFWAIVLKCEYTFFLWIFIAMKCCIIVTDELKKQFSIKYKRIFSLWLDDQKYIVIWSIRCSKIFWNCMWNNNNSDVRESLDWIWRNVNIFTDFKLS